MKEFSYKNKWIVWVNDSDQKIVHVEAESKEEAEQKALALDYECWEHVDGSGEFDIDEAVPLIEDEIWHSRRGHADLQEAWDSAVAKPVSSIAPSDKKITLPPEVWIQLYSEIGAFILEYASLDPVTEVDENGDERYTEEKQDEYCDLCAQVEDILETFFNKGE